MDTCDFCGRGLAEVEYLVTSFSAAICDACVAECAGVVAAHRRPASRPDNRARRAAVPGTTTRATADGPAGRPSARLD